MDKEVKKAIERLEQEISNMKYDDAKRCFGEYLLNNDNSAYIAEIYLEMIKILGKKREATKLKVMTELAMKDITDYDEVVNVAINYGLSIVDAKKMAEMVRAYEEKHVFNARELSKVDFRKYCNNLLIVSGIDDATKALIVKAGFEIKPEDNSMIVFCYIDHVYGARFHFIAPAKRNDIGEIEIGASNSELSLELCLDSFEGKVEVFPGEVKLTKDMINTIQRIVTEKKVCEGVEDSRLVDGLDHLRIPGYPDDIVVRFNKNTSEYESVVCRIEDFDKNLNKFKFLILKEPEGSYDKHIGDIIEARLMIPLSGQYTVNAYFDSDSLEKKNDIVDKNVKVLKPTDFLIRTTDYQCIYDNHELEQMTVVVTVLNPNEIIEATFPACYCRKCNRYYVLDSYYSQLKYLGYICCRIDTYDSLMHPDNNNYFGKINEKSILMNYGYSVEKRKELSEEERHNILAFMLDNKIISKSKIIDYLKWFIQINVNQNNKQNAIEKWNKDIKFVYGYRIGEANMYSEDYKHKVKKVVLEDLEKYVQKSIEDYFD